MDIELFGYGGLGRSHRPEGFDALYD